MKRDGHRVKLMMMMVMMMMRTIIYTRNSCQTTFFTHGEFALDMDIRCRAHLVPRLQYVLDLHLHLQIRLV